MTSNKPIIDDLLPNPIDVPVDDPGSFPDFRTRVATDEELASLESGIAHLSKVVKDFENEVAFEDFSRDVVGGPQATEAVEARHVPDTLVPFIRASLKLAQTMAKEPQNAEMAVGHLRVATVLVRLLNTWEGDVGEHRVDRLFR